MSFFQGPIGGDRGEALVEEFDRPPSRCRDGLGLFGHGTGRRSDLTGHGQRESDHDQFGLFVVGHSFDVGVIDRGPRRTLDHRHG